MISAVDWESDGSLGSQTVPVTVDVTNTTDTFPCPVGKSLVLEATEYILANAFLTVSLLCNLTLRLVIFLCNLTVMLVILLCNLTLRLVCNLTVILVILLCNLTVRLVVLLRNLTIRSVMFLCNLLEKPAYQNRPIHLCCWVYTLPTKFYST